MKAATGIRIKLLFVAFGFLATSGIALAGSDLFVGSYWSWYVDRWDGQTFALANSLETWGEGTQDLVTGPDGNLYLTDKFNTSIQGFHTSGGFPFFHTEATNFLPWDVACDPTGSYIFGSAGGRLQKYSLGDGHVIATVNVPFSQGPGINFGPDGYLTSSRIKINPGTGAIVGSFSGDGFGQAWFGAYSNNGFYYLGTGDKILRFNAFTCEYLGIFAQTTLGFFGDIAFSPEGDLFAVVAANDRSGVVHYNGSTGAYLGAAIPIDHYFRTAITITFAPVPEPDTALALLAMLTLFTTTSLLRRK